MSEIVQELQGDVPDRQPKSEIGDDGSYQLPSGFSVVLKKVGPVTFRRIVGGPSDDGEKEMRLVVAGVKTPAFALPDDKGEVPEGKTSLDDLSMADYFDLAAAVSDFCGIKEAMDILNPSSGTSTGA